MVGVEQVRKTMSDNVRRIFDAMDKHLMHQYGEDKGDDYAEGIRTGDRESRDTSGGWAG